MNSWRRDDRAVERDTCALAQRNSNALLWLINCTTETLVHLMLNYKWFVHFKQNQICSFSVLLIFGLRQFLPSRRFWTHFSPIELRFFSGTLQIPLDFSDGHQPIFHFHGQHDKRFLYQFISFRFRPSARRHPAVTMISTANFYHCPHLFYVLPATRRSVYDRCFLFVLCRFSVVFAAVQHLFGAVNAVCSHQRFICCSAGSLSFLSRLFCHKQKICLSLWLKWLHDFFSLSRDIEFINYIDA